MLKFFVNLFNPPGEERKIRELQPLRLEIKASDAFGKSLQRYNNELDEADRIVASKLLQELILIGSVTQPPKNWHHLSKSFAHNNIHEFVANWQAILNSQVHAARLIRRHGSIYQQNCRISSSNLYAARGILWFYIYQHGSSCVPNVLQFASNCLADFNNCSDGCKQLANAAVDMLLKEVSFANWKNEVPFYPNLEEDIRVKSKLQNARKRINNFY